MGPFNTIKNTTSIQNESLHRPSMRRSRLSWRRHVRHEENAKNMGRTQGYGIMLRREYDEDILAQNEKVQSYVRTQWKPSWSPTKSKRPNPTCPWSTTSSSRKHDESHEQPRQARHR